MRIRSPILIAVLVAGLATGVSAASETGARAPSSVYAAFSLVSTAPPSTKRCGAFTIVKGSYRATAASPDGRLAGRVRFTGRFGVNATTGYGFARGRLTSRTASGKLRLSAVLNGVISNTNVVNGVVSGRLAAKNELLIANTTIVFNENFTFGAVRLGLESGQNSAIAYTALPPACR